MADLEKPKHDGPPESPTTARELDFDDEEIISTPRTSRPATGISAAPEEAPPPQPPRPISLREQNEKTLKEAFPTIDTAVIKAVLTASSGNIEPAFNALLGMSDPDSQHEPPPPPQPPRPVASPRAQPGLSQLEADEQYARQLAEHYNGTAAYQPQPRSTSREQRGPRIMRPKRETGLKPNELNDDREHNFFDDELPVIRDNIRKGFLETQSKVNSFIKNLTKKIDGDDEEVPARPGRTSSGYGPSGSQQLYGSRHSGDLGRRSGDRDRYDADPQVLGDDFATLQMRDETAPQRRSTRPLANPDLFKPTPAAPGERKVSFQEGPPEEVGALHRDSPDPSRRSKEGTGRGKWQPLAAVEPSPVVDHDPFSLGDSDDEEGGRKKDDAVKKPVAEANEGGVGEEEGEGKGGKS